MASHWFNRVSRIGGLVTLLAAIGAASATAGPERGQKQRRTGFSLRASPNEVLNVNRVFCGINNLGEICVDPTNSPVLGGGFWPKGTPDQYIFNSGLQLAGIVDAPGFAWDGDTTGAYFMDPRGTQAHGAGVTNVYSSLNPDDAANWPTGAVARDPAIFHPTLVGRNTVSQQDVWVRAWDGDPTLSSGRTHPLGVLVETRGMAWNFPSGNEDIVYFIYRFYNVTASDADVYSGLDAAIAPEIAAIGADFQARSESRLGVNIPDEGYAIDDMYAAFFMDPDVGDAGANYSTAILPFSLGVAYNGHFQEANWQFPPEIFGAPFYPAPGFVGVKYLRSPIDPDTGEEVGLTLFSNTLNQAGGFPDPVGVLQLWRYLSGHVNPGAGDNPCTITNPRERRLCFLYQELTDTRFYQSSGPLRLEPGEFQTIVVAYIHAAPVADPLEDSGQIGGDLKPGIPFSGDSIAAGTCSTPCVRTIDSIAGWLTHADVSGPGGVGPADGIIQQHEVTSVPRSLLDKAIVAQAVFDNQFLLPFAPQAPDFFLVPGDNQVTVVWQRSPSEVAGDPFFDIANDPASPLFNPNFRAFDVEGYRVYRGRSVAQLELVAQFDYAGTTFIDFTGGFDYGNACAPELGTSQADPTNDLGDDDGCPVDFSGGESNTLDIVGNLIQVPPGGRVELADGSVFVINADTAVTGAGFPALTNSGVPFAFVDTDVRNSFTYHYAVTAFDVNSVASGPTSLESPRITKAVIPRAPAANKVAAEVTIELIDRDGNVIDPDSVTPPTINADGTFSGPAVPTAGFESLGAELFADQLLINGSEVVIRLDSIAPFYYHDGTYHFTVFGAETTQVAMGGGLPLGEEDGPTVIGPVEVTFPADREKGQQVGLGALPVAGRVQAQASAHPVTYQSRDADWHVAVQGSFFALPDPEIVDDGGSRWFTGDNESMADPTLGDAHGQLPNVNVIYSPAPFVNVSQALFRRNMQTVYHEFRAADIKVYWGATPGTVDSVIDVTHNMPLEFNGQVRANWGFRDDISGDGLDFTAAGGPDGDVDFYDFGHGPCYPQRPNWSSPGCETRPLLNTASLSPVDVTGDAVADGQGFAMYINAEFYFFQTDQLPSNTVWTLRTYMGHVEQTADGYTFTPKPSNPAVPGMRIRATVTQSADYPTDVAVNLDSVHTVPDPYYVTNVLEQTPNTKVLKFVNLPSQAIIRIYSLSGVLVAILEHNDPTGGGAATWNLRNRNNAFVASGVYFYHVETPSGQEKVGRFTVVNFAQ